MDLKLAHYPASNGVEVIKVVGGLDVYTSPRMRELVIELSNAGYLRLVFDLSQAEWIELTALGVLISALKRTILRKGEEGSVVLFITEERVLKIFRITGLVKVFAITDTLSEAITWAAARGRSSEDQTEVNIPPGDEVGWHWFPARIYSSETDAGRAIERSFSELVESFGISIAYEFPVKRSSWFREFILRMKDSTSLPTRDEQLALMRRALEMQVLGRPQAQIDMAQSQAVASLLVALEKTPNAMVQVGSVLLIKVQGTMIVRNLTQLELAHWEKNPGLFHDPEKAMQELQRASDSANVTAGAQHSDGTPE